VTITTLVGDDDGGLSWEEFEGFFLGAGWGNASSGAIGDRPTQSTMKMTSK